MLHSLLLAFALYSRIPFPQTQWNEKNMRWCICFLPLVGAVLGACQYLLFRLLDFRFGRGSGLLCGALLCAFPVVFTGGLHMDGFLDTCDAIGSWKTREERLRILKDSHVGAFAVLGGILCMLVSLGIWSEADRDNIGLLCLTFVLSRSLSAFAALTFPKARKDGLLRQETDPVPRGAAAVMAAAAAAVMAAMIFLDLIPGISTSAAALVTLFYYRRTADRLFGGTTGDLAGWFLQLCELTAGLVIVLAAGVF